MLLTEYYFGPLKFTKYIILYLFIVDIKDNIYSSTYVSVDKVTFKLVQSYETSIVTIFDCTYGLFCDNQIAC